MTKEQALERLRSRCSRAEYCSGQIAETLRRWIGRGAGRLPVASVAEGEALQLCESDIPGIISQLKAEKFIDDSRFAAAFVRDKLKFNGWGPQKILYKLRSFGIDPAIINAAISENCNNVDEGALSGRDVLEKLLVKKWKSLKVEEPLQNRKSKVIRFAVGRGFEYGEIIAALEKIIK